MVALVKATAALALAASVVCARTVEHVRMMQVNSAAQLAEDHKEKGVEGMLQTVKALAEEKGEKPSTATLGTLTTIEGLVDDILVDLGTEHTSLQSRADASTSMIDACDSAWTLANGHRSNAETTMDGDMQAHSQCRATESAALAEQTQQCTAMTNFHTMLKGETCDEPATFDRDNSETYMTCLDTFWTTYASENTKKIAACEDAEAVYAANHTMCNEKQGTFEQAACAHYTEHAAMCAAYSECRPPAVEDFENQKAAIQLEETSLKNQYTVLQTIKCYVREIQADNSDETAVALDCANEVISTTDFDIVLPSEPAVKLCQVGLRPCEAGWAPSYASLPDDAPAGDCAACPEYSAESEYFLVVAAGDHCNPRLSSECVHKDLDSLPAGQGSDNCASSFDHAHTRYIGVGCCRDDGTGFRPADCRMASSQEDAAQVCENAGGRLCGDGEILNQEGQGCGFDAVRVWTSTPCTP